MGNDLTVDLIRAKTPIDTDVTVIFHPVAHSSRTAEIHGTVIDHDDALILGVHPNLYVIPFDQVFGIV